jgi:hypothetical protein
MKKLLLLACAAPLVSACVGTTGGDLVDFNAVASGPPSASGSPGGKHSFEFETVGGYEVTLTKAKLQIGAVYLLGTPCAGSSAPTTCGDPTVTAVAQVNGGVDEGYGVLRSGVDVDALSPDAQAFDSQGTGIEDPGLPAQSAMVWLSGGVQGMAIYSDDPVDIAEVAGTAVKDGKSYLFNGTVTINSQNRGMQGTNAEPGLNPLCLQRIVAPICLDRPLTPTPGKRLHVEVDPRHWFDNVDFSKLTVIPGVPAAIPDDNTDPNGRNLFQSIESSTGVYSFTFEAP